MQSTAGAATDRETGSVTAELVVALPALLLTLSAAIWGVGAGAAQVRCLDAAREGARTAARGEPPAEVLAAARRAAPAGATIRVRRNGDLVRVSVAASVAPLGMLAGRAPALHVSGAATADVEAAVPRSQP
ncbi:MAG: TadE family type IV pilus minor pilin [Mycobacteriales bacterium]